MYRQYRSTYSNCTYIDGNVELVFLTEHPDYDLSFLKVLLITQLYHTVGLQHDRLV